MSKTHFFDQTGSPVELGAKIAAGGEGEILEVVGDVNRVAKLYFKPPSPATATKLGLMASISRASPTVLKTAAWPTATLHESPGSPARGFLMPRAKGEPVHALYHPGRRQQTFPQADWKFLIHAAMNTAIAFQTAHETGVVIGDVNQGNVLISQDALAVLIDCDSFQVRSNGSVFRCEVGVPHFTPPELQSVTRFTDIDRTVNHDLFGLSVLIFHILYMGRHPFAGRFLGRGDMPLETAISQYRFAFGPTAQANEMSPPPRSLALEVASPQIVQLFGRAFGRGSERPDARPMASEWVTALDSFKKQLRSCTIDRSHSIPPHLSSCPWCEMLRAGGPSFFVPVLVQVAQQGGVFSIEAIWAEIERVSVPSPKYVRPAATQSGPILPTPIPASLAEHREQWVVVSIFAFSGLVVATTLGFMAFGWGVFIAFVPFSFVLWDLSQRVTLFGRERLRRVERANRVAADLQETETKWRRVAQGILNAFNEKKQELGRARQQYLEGKSSFERELRQLESQREQLQMAVFLRTQFISDYKIQGIGPSKLATLNSYGIETAYDVQQDRVLQVPGFGDKLTLRLTQWRAEVSRQFRFDPRIPVPRAELLALDARYRTRLQALEVFLSGGPELLKGISAKTAELAGITGRARKLVGEVCVANADRAVVQRFDRIARGGMVASVLAIMLISCVWSSFSSGRSSESGGLQGGALVPSPSSYPTASPAAPTHHSPSPLPVRTTVPTVSPTPVVRSVGQVASVDSGAPLTRDGKSTPGVAPTPPAPPALPTHVKESPSAEPPRRGRTFEEIDAMFGAASKLSDPEKDAAWKRVAGEVIEWTGEIVDTGQADGTHVYVRQKPSRFALVFDVAIELKGKAVPLESVSAGTRIKYRGKLGTWAHGTGVVSYTVTDGEVISAEPPTTGGPRW